MAAPIVCVPGQRICRNEDSIVASEGTYIRNGFVFSSLAGFLSIEKTERDTQLPKTTVSVRTRSEQNVVPTVDAVVTTRITNVNPRFCKCSIICVGKTVLKEPFRGMIRKEDVRATEKDRVEMYKCYRPGDVVLARVLSLGDAHSYLLSTAENELGVVMANSEAGAPMTPISWCKMKCPKTLSEEHRKVAKVQPEYIKFVGT